VIPLRSKPKGVIAVMSGQLRLNSPAKVFPGAVGLLFVVPFVIKNEPAAIFCLVDAHGWVTGIP